MTTQSLRVVLNLYGSASGLRVAVHVRGKERTDRCSLSVTCTYNWSTARSFDYDIYSSNLKAEYDSNNVQQKQDAAGWSSLLILVIRVSL